MRLVIVHRNCEVETLYAALHLPSLFHSPLIIALNEYIDNEIRRATLYVLLNHVIHFKFNERVMCLLQSFFTTATVISEL